MKINKTIEKPNWVDHIQFFFTNRDKECMLKSDNPFDLGSYKDVSRIANKIYNVVESGRMPLGGPEWSIEKKDSFYNWYDLGCPFDSGIAMMKSLEEVSVSRIRKNVKNLTIKEEELLAKAFIGIMGRDSDDLQGYYQIAGIHGYPNSYCEHHSNQYNPWHRFYLIQFEDALRSVPECENVTLPYWDITDSEFPSLFEKEPFNTYQVPETLPSINHPQIGKIEFSNPYNTTRLSGAEIIQNIDLLGIKEQISMALASKTWEEFHGWVEASDTSNTIIAAHDNGHATFGHPSLPGNLISSLMLEYVAAFEPLFWLFHCNWDRLWWEWQKLNGATTIDGLKNSIEGSKRWLDRKIEPFKRKPAESVDLTEINLVDGVGINYTESSLLPESLAPEIVNAKGSLFASGATRIKSKSKVSVMVKNVNRISIPGTFSLSLKSDDKVISRQFFFQNMNPPKCENCSKMPYVNFTFIVDLDEVASKRLEIEIEDLKGNQVPLIHVGNPSLNVRLLLEREMRNK